MTDHKTCDVLECVCGIPWEPDSEQFGCWSCGSTSYKYEDEETHCTHPERGTKGMTDLSAKWDEIENADMPNIFKYAYEQARIYNGYDADAWDRLEPAKRAHKVSCFLIDMLVAHHGGETVERMIINVDTHAVEVDKVER